MKNIINNSKSVAKIDWINCAKFLAIVAVLIDHTNGILYTNQDIASGSYFSVSLFILVSGYLSFSSNKKHNLSYFQTIIKSCRKIVLAYLLATLIYIVVSCHFFDFKIYINAVSHFSVSGPFYYVLLYIQLMIVNKLVYKFLAFSSRVKKAQQLFMILC